MAVNNHHGGMVIFTSFVIAMLLVALPLPEWAQQLRPDWALLVLIYWCMALPERFGIGLSWLVGLFIDVLTGALLGQHALAYAVVAFVVMKLHKRVRVFPLWQQALLVLILSLLSQLLTLWIKGAIDRVPGSWTYWLPSITSTLIWPWAFLLMRDIRRRFRVQ
jgi:rod shape-determining protein MreD